MFRGLETEATGKDEDTSLINSGQEMPEEIDRHHHSSSCLQKVVNKQKDQQVMVHKKKTSACKSKCVGYEVKLR